MFANWAATLISSSSNGGHSNASSASAKPAEHYGNARADAGVAELLRMLRRDTIIIIIIIGGGATNRGVETSVREAYNVWPAPSASRDHESV